MDAYLRQSLEALGLPVIVPEPEVVASTLTRVRTGALASLLTRWINDNEPSLRASHEAATVTVREAGSDAVMRFTIEEAA